MLSIFIAIIFLGCSKDETTIITGTITEALSGQPIEGF
jgi:hypothetical protein